MGQFEEQLGARENLVGFLRWSYIDCWNWRLWGQWQKFPRIIYLWNIDRIRRLPKTWSFRCFRKLQASLDNTSHRAHPLFLGACSTTVWNGGNLQYSTWLKVVHHRIMGRTYIFDLPKNERVIAPKKNTVWNDNVSCLVWSFDHGFSDHLATLPPFLKAPPVVRSWTL